MALWGNIPEVTEIGVVLAAETHGPNELVATARIAEELGFDRVWVSDHFHPWVGAQGESPFVWSVIGGIAATTGTLRVGTGVTCPTIRIHPAIVAQAAATSAVMLDGRFFLGVGTGENLNEHVLGDPWPTARRRLEMLEESVAVMRQLWTGELVNHDGDFYRVDRARLFSIPDDPPPVYMSAFGPRAIELAGRTADGFVTTAPSSDAIESYRAAGGDGPTLAGTKVAYGADADTARRRVAQTWPTLGLPGQLGQDLPTVAHFEQAVSMLDEDDIVGDVPCGPDAEHHARHLQRFVDAGFDEVYVEQIGDQEAFVRFYADEVLPHVDFSEAA